MTRRARILIVVTLSLSGVVSVSGAGEIPDRPEKLVFKPLEYTPPAVGDARFQLTNGIPVFAVEDRQLPLITLTMLIRGGRLLEPTGKEGVAALTGAAWRKGGAGDLDARAFDEKLDFLAAELSTTFEDLTGTVRLNVLSKDFDQALALLVDLVQRPRFQEDRFALEKTDQIQLLKKRNDDSFEIQRREINRLWWGDEYWRNRLPTQASIEAITAADCRAFLALQLGADNVTLALAGDFNRQEMEQKLNGAFGSLARLASPVLRPPRPEHAPVPGVYMVDKPDFNQGGVVIGHPSVEEGHPDELALRVLQEIYGMGGTSRLYLRIRAAEGLAYSAYSRFTLPLGGMPGAFVISFQSKSSTCIRATQIAREELKRIREELVSDEELKRAKASLIETLPDSFESPEVTAKLFAQGELLGRPAEYWSSYAEKVRAVTAEEVLKAAAAHMKPETLVFLYVGNTADIRGGHPDHAGAIEDFGPITMVPLRDPLTLAEPAATSAAH
ncbi:MAG: insulinase family protein [Candidatus Schekmanbacteria bacterium]|nr:insulinase family protein [Candidatus Schekmanbacteria bacterium]